MVFGGLGGGGNGFADGFWATGAGLVRVGTRAGCFWKSAHPNGALEKAPKRRKRVKASMKRAPVQALVSLQKQEQIQGTENGSIARFDGLGCYQTNSEISGGFGMELGASRFAGRWGGLQSGFCGRGGQPRGV